MSIEDRNLKPGTVLVARYKKQDFRCEVVAAEDGKVLYKLEDGREFKSPSSAGGAVMGGVACNGWRFWSVQGAEEPKPEAKPKGKGKAKGRSKKAEPEAEAEQKIACGECGQEFASSRECAEHMRDEHNSPEAAGNGGP